MTTIARVTAWTEQPPVHTAIEAMQQFRWSVFPLDEEKKPPKIGGSHADGTPKRLAWKQFQARFPSLKEVQWWERSFTPSAWGVITGAMSRLIVLDFDGEQGQRLCRQLELNPHVQTGSGGAHVYFHHPGWHVPTLNSTSNEEFGRRWPGLDIRADGGYAAFCGRNLVGPYRWLRDPTPENLDILPDDLRTFLGLLVPPQTQMQASEASVKQETETPEHLDQVLLKRALRMVTTGTGRNDAGFWLTCQLRDNSYSQEHAQDIMRLYAARVPAKNSKGQPEAYTIQEALASVSSAYQGKVREAWDVTSAPATNPGRAGGSGGSPPAIPASPEYEGEFPEIILGGDQLREVTDLAMKAVLQNEQRASSLFLQSSRLVRVGRNELKHPIIAQMGVSEVKEVLTHSANYYRLKKIPGAEGEYLKVPASPPKEVAEQVLARQTQYPYLSLPPLQGIVETPVVRPDGTVLDTPGYDVSTFLYYAPHPDVGIYPVPMSPTKEEQAQALALLWETIGEFRYVSEADRANALALLLTPILRPAIKRHVPLALLDAPKPGSGKGLLADVVATIATGESAAILTAPDNDEEWDKRITAMLMQGRTIICIDNIAGRLQSSKLDAVLTADVHEGRILGQSTMIRVPNRATWLATGNNVKLGGDLARRCYRIRLDPHDSRPWMRKGFKHEDLVTWVGEHRGELIRALLILVRAWYAADQPLVKELPALGTFTGWVRLVGSILAYAGVEGFLTNLEQLYTEADELSAQWEAFLRAWYALFRSTPVKTSDLFEKMQHDAEGAEGASDDDLLESLPENLQITYQSKRQSFSVFLGKALEKRVDECFGRDNLRLERVGKDRKGAVLWRVVAEGAEGAEGVSLRANTKNVDDTQNKILCNNERNNPRHPRHPSECDVTQSGLGSGTNPLLPPEEVQVIPSAPSAPSAEETESEEFLL